MTSQLEKKVLVGLGLASVIIAGLTVVYHISTERLVETAGRVTETHALIESLADFENNYQTARMATRGYLLTGEEDVLELYRWSKREAIISLATLRTASAGDKYQRRAVDEIEQMAHEQLARCEQLTSQRSQSDISPTLEAVNKIYRDDAKDPLRRRIHSLLSRGREQLNDRESLARESSAAMMWLLSFGAVVEFAFALAAAGVIRRHIRDRAGAVDALKRNEAMLRGFYGSGATMMGIVEPLDDEKDVLFISANAATARLYQGRQIVEGRRASELGSPPQITQLFLQKYREALRENGPVQFETELPTGRGNRWFTVVVCPIAGGSRRPHFSFVMLDQTERKTAEKALQLHAAELAETTATLERQTLELLEARQAAERANEAKSSFLANMSHEIRTPITAVVGYADLLAEPGRGEEQRRDWIGVIRRNARHLLQLMNDILDLSKIDAGRMTVESVACEPAQIVADVVTMLRPRAEEKGIVLRLDQESALPRDMGSDPLRLRQVMVNLLGNAIKFTEVGEVSVRISCEPPAPSDDQGTTGTLQIEVRDTGIGISREQLARLFQPFTQADESTTRRFGGSGLGLAISHQLVGLLGGHLTARSEPGIGSVFAISLPVRAAVDERAGGEGTDDEPPLLYGQTEPAALRGRILVAEDAPDTQRLLSIVLGGAGAEVTIAPNGKIAVREALKQSFDLILMDMQMPEMDGYAATRELRRKGVNIPIIALTGHAMGGDRERALAAGCDEYLTKPIDVPLLLARVARHLAAASAGLEVA